MDEKEYVKINTLQMHYFLEVAENGSFTNAARQLYTTQSTLSKTIRTLEENLGVTLFIRSHKRLALTEAGKHLYEKWVRILLDIDRSIEECRILQGGYTNMLSIGVLDSHNPEVFAMPDIRSFLKSHPQVSLNIQSCQVQEIRKHLLSSNLDLAYTVLYDLEQFELDELSYFVINECPHNVAMLASNPLSDREYLEIHELKDSLFVSISPLYTPSYTGMIRDLCSCAGFEPKFIRYTNSATSLPFNLVSDRDIFICDRNFRGYQQPSFTSLQFRPLIHTKSGIAAVWRKDNTKPALQNFLKQIRRNPREWF